MSVLVPRPPPGVPTVQVGDATGTVAENSPDRQQHQHHHDEEEDYDTPSPHHSLAGSATSGFSLLSPAGSPFSPADLQRQFVGMDARAVYALLCRRNNCRVISSVVDQLPDKPGVWDLQQLDLEKTYVGHRGLVPVVELCKLLHKLQSVSFANNYLTNKSVWFACKMLLFHPTVSSVSFACNDVSWTAGMCVLELATRNANIRAVDVTETLLQPKVAQAILTQIRRNVAGATGKEQKKRAQSSNPIAHARAVRIRALKRLFRDLLSKKGTPDSAAAGGGRVPRECVAEGLVALAALSGKERELEQRGPDYVKSVAARAPADMVEWEAFLLLVLFPEVPFRREHVDSLRRLFNSVNSDGSGYVFAAELPAMLAAVLGHPPTPQELQSKLDYFGLVHDDTVTTMTFDEFLVLVSEHGPEVGEHVTHATKTPMSRQGIKPPHH